MSKLANKWTADNDFIPSLVRDCRCILAEPFTALIYLAVKKTTFPDRWKIARVTPVLNKCYSQLFSDYGPISVLYNFAKVMEQ